MQEVFSKIIEKLEERKQLHNRMIDYENKNGTVYEEFQQRKAVEVLNYAIEIVKQEAEQYNNGWIPCSERLPEESLNDVIGWDAYRERCCFVHYIGGRFILGDDTESVKITHWMPTPYQPKGE